MNEAARVKPPVTWFLDEVNGDDMNTGLSRGQAFQTQARLSKAIDTNSEDDFLVVMGVDIDVDESKLLRQYERGGK